MSDQPWDFATARQACRDASQAQQAAEDALVQAYRDYAAAEENYRVALAKQIISEHDADRSWSVSPDLARGDSAVAALRHKRDVAEGVKDAMQQACWRRVADRKDAQRFADWSQRREFAEAYGQAIEPESPEVIGSGQRPRVAA
jgi:hypothetical protein